ncbi:ester cyclase [Streptomyces sp. M19]
MHNDRTLRVAEFQDLLRRDATEIPDLHYAIERLVTQGEEVACRIRFDCTPPRTSAASRPPAARSRSPSMSSTTTGTAGSRGSGR